MAGEKRYILGVHIPNRVKQAPEIQKVLTEYGCFIRMRLGLHEARKDYCSGSGLILLEMVDGKKVSQLIRRIKQFKGVGIQKMVFACD